jgi:hypothetical protein
VSAPKPATKRSETGQRRPAPPEFQRPTRRLARDRRAGTDLGNVIADLLDIQCKDPVRVDRLQSRQMLGARRPGGYCPGNPPPLQPADDRNSAALQIVRRTSRKPRLQAGKFAPDLSAIGIAAPRLSLPHPSTFTPYHSRIAQLSGTKKMAASGGIVRLSSGTNPCDVLTSPIFPTLLPP